MLYIVVQIFKGIDMIEPGNSGSEKPKITRPKPAIASKPKYVPPVNLKVIPKPDQRFPANGREQSRLEENTVRHQGIPFRAEPSETYPPEPLIHQSFKTQGTTFKVTTIQTRNGHNEYKIPKPKNVVRNTEKAHSGAPNSPSTVCCSILSNTSDCCNIMGIHKKEIESKSMTKIDSLDSNSSDSGGFRDFIQLDNVKKLSIETEKYKSDRKLDGHIRKFSQPEFLEKSVAERAKTLTQSFSERKSTEYVYQQNRNELEDMRKVSRQNLIQHVVPNHIEKTEDTTNLSKTKPQLFSHGQFKQSTKKLEEVLSQRLERDKQRHRRGASCHDADATNQGKFEHQMIIQKEFQQKLQADLKQTVKQIQEIQSIELRLPQNRCWDEVCFIHLLFQYL